MTDRIHDAADMTPRRGFFTRVAGVMALGFAAFVPTSSRAQTVAARSPPADRFGRPSYFAAFLRLRCMSA